jgi:DNA (cytosine-5)-methyltransferase 1
VLDMFAGPRGWSEGLRALGYTGREVGIEIDKAACATAEAAGHEVVQGDIFEMDPHEFVGFASHVDGIIASPPCPTFSAAGGRHGRHLIDIILACLRDAAQGIDTRESARQEAYKLLLPIMEDKERFGARKAGREPNMKRAQGRAWRDACMSILVVEPMRWIYELRPTWVALEQVPEVQGVWQIMAELLRGLGYSVWTGVLEAERFGVAQTRERAILMADLERTAQPPHPTHQRFVPGEPARHDLTLEGEILPWVSMAEALGRGMTARPAPTVQATSDSGGGPRPIDGGSHARMVVQREIDEGRWLYERRGSKDGHTGQPNRQIPDDEPAPTIAGESRNDSWVVGFGREGDENGPQTEDGLRERDFRSIDEPAHAVTEKARSWVMRQNDRENGTVRAGDEPAPTITGGHDFNERRWEVHDTGNTRGEGEPHTDGRVRSIDEPAVPITSRADQLEHRMSEPATTVAGDSRIQPRGHKQSSIDPPGKYEGRDGKNAIRVEPWEAAVLQSFRPDYPFQGSRMAVFRQIGDAVPPLLARAVLEPLVRM